MNKYICKNCLDNFKTSSLLLKHQRTSKTCITYSNIIFICENCNFTTKGIKNIDKHIKENSCKNTDTDTILSDDLNEYIFDDSDEEDKQIIDSNIDIKEELSLQKQIIKLETELKKEKIKNNTYIEIIDKLKSKDIDLIVNTTTPVIIDNQYIRQISPCNSENKSTDECDTKSYKSYKTIKIANTDSPKEPDKQEVENHIKKIDHEYYCKKQNFGIFEKCSMAFKQEFDNMKESRITDTTLENIKNIRQTLIGSIPIEQYKNLVEEHVKIINNLLESKGHQTKKIPILILKSLNSLDARLIYYGNYHDTTLNIDEFSRLKTSLEIFAKSYRYYSPFMIEEFAKHFYNYGSVLVPLKTCIEYYIFNRYGFNNIVYVPLKQSSDDDPYSYYILEGVVKDKRYWKMDCRLFELTENIINSLKHYLISIFRKIYQVIFKDNEYREDYSKYVVLRNDAQQLLKNIFLLSDKKTMCNYLREIIKERSTYIPKQNDKFNLTADDVILKKKASKYIESDKVELVKMLFDNISSTQAVDFYRGIN